MFDEDHILQKTKWLDTIVAVAVAFALTILGALIMRWVEQRFAAAHAEAITTEAPATGATVSARLYDGYVIRDSTLRLSVAASEVPVVPSAEVAPSLTRSFLNRLFGVKTAYAAETPAYAAELISQTYERVRVSRIGAFTMIAEFRNTGNATWTNSGKNFVALNVSEPAGRDSAFWHAFWPDWYRPGRLQQAAVKPGEVGRVAFALKVPSEPGTYVEQFGLVAEDLTWIPGGELSLTVTVPQPYEARRVGALSQSVRSEPGRAFTFWADFKNMGTATWTNQGEHFVALNVSEPAGRDSAFQHDFWPAPYRPARLLQPVVRPGEIGRFQFALRAPEQIGTYVENFGLVAENLLWIPGGTLRLPIRVGSTESLGQAEGEPLIRVGLTAGLNPVEITANGTFRAKAASGRLLMTLEAGSVATVRYADGIYTLKATGSVIRTRQALRFVPTKGTIMEVENYEHRPAWNSALNDNIFRGVIEVRYAEATGRLWVINELPLEAYLRGVAETSNASPAEFQKALMIAARSYAYYHTERNTKHANERFTVDATYDQVYRGYGFEQRAPAVVAAVKATAGQVVAYDGRPVITPYFSNTDGRTRSWEEVWAGGPYPWLVSVPDPWSNGKPLNGHGVGLSAFGAIGQANEGKTAADILKYYYTGTTLLSMY